MKRSSLVGFVAVAVIIACLFIYIDFFAPRILTDDENATTTPQTATSTPNPAEPQVVTKGNFTLGLNEKIKVVDSMITPLSVDEDSRCPTSVQCIWEGRVVVAVSIASPNEPNGETRTKMKPGDVLKRSNFTLTLKDVIPYPDASKKIQNSEYRFVFEAEPNVI